jgi:DNA-binding CsgD family transcriptional regulator
MIMDGASAMGFGGVAASGQAALAVRDLAEGSYEDAYRRLKPLIDEPFLQVTPLELPDFVEAACRSRHGDEAALHVAHLEDMASANGSVWTSGVAHRSRALVEDDAEPHFRAAVATLDSTDLEIELARAHLLYGEWLRRARRRREAREQLRRALELFEHGQAPVFARRARTELHAIGDRPASAGVPDPLDLTVQQLTVARLAAAGHTNAEIGSTMFLSPNTVDYHLRKVFQKLGISSRRQLADRVGRTP